MLHKCLSTGAIPGNLGTCHEDLAHYDLCLLFASQHVTTARPWGLLSAFFLMENTDFNAADFDKDGIRD